ncbi:MAG: ABC transporter ATP-binding protein, partial [Lentisphaerae bacterium]|nr:ABC transporter ATP-binding protein [Lentisphaerota bacterium]
TVLDKVNLEIEPGELFFLLGPSGCGKTTLLRHIAGFYTPDEGEVHIDGDNVTHVPPHKRDTGMVFQSYALWPHLTVTENVAFGLQMRKVSKVKINERVRKALKTVKMEKYATSKPNQLSGGQQQRIALARALVVEPRCLLLDEPLSNLDAKLRLEMRVEIRRICKEAGLTAVYVTHDQKEALSIADRIAIMRNGIIEQIGSPVEIYRKPKNTFTASFIGETNFLPADFFGSKFNPGSAKHLSIRPEAIHIEGGDTFPDSLSFEGNLYGTVYLGESAQHLMDVVTPDGKSVTITIFQLNPQVLVREESRKVTARVNLKDIVALPE